ncbi:MAG: hypothetical protein C0468_07080 [Planctomyces sp.]|nr:hypothetical protein [Planctomyces sp.]
MNDPRGVIAAVMGVLVLLGVPAGASPGADHASAGEARPADAAVGVGAAVDVGAAGGSAAGVPAGQGRQRPGRADAVGAALALARGRAARVLITRPGVQLREDLLALPPMAQRVAGVIGELTGAQARLVAGAAQRRGAAGQRAGGEDRGEDGGDAGDAGDAGHIGDLWVLSGADQRRVALHAPAAGRYEARAGADRSALRASAIAAVLMELGGYVGGFGPGAGEPRGRAFDVAMAPVSHAPGLVEWPETLTASEYSKRLGKSRLRFEAVTRRLQSERMWARLPASYDPKSPAGLLVWVDASPSGKPPAALHPALDALGFIAIGAERSGNDRHVSERMQLALDAVATAQRRWHIDPRRVYVTGISGGGKMTTLLWAGYPEVFAGALPIVGLSAFADTPTGEGGRFWPAEFERPSGRAWQLLKTRRLGPVTGPADFNYAPMKAMAPEMARLGLEVRLFDVPGMGHTMPPPATFVEQLMWADEPARSERQRGIDEARGALGALGPSAGRDALLDIVRRWPWTPAAWEALERAGLSAGPDPAPARAPAPAPDPAPGGGANPGPQAGR